MAELDVKRLVGAAIAASDHAYIPYSNYPVGAALLTTDGTIYTGCNVENVAFPATICAERTALVKAISEGHREFSALAVASRTAGPPCGVCRQMLYEFAPHLRVLVADLDQNIHHDVSMEDLLRFGFGPAALQE